MEKERYDPLKIENQLCFPLYVASKELVRAYRPHLEKIGLTYTQYIAMMMLWESKKMSVKELGDKLFLDSGTLTPVLKVLEKKGLLTRKRSFIDERVLDIELTQKGEQLKQTAFFLPGFNWNLVWLAAILVGGFILLKLNTMPANKKMNMLLGMSSLHMGLFLLALTL